MATLFPRNFYNADASFTPLFRLLEDFDNYSRQGTAGSRSNISHFQPKFDVRELADHYELHGELPGLSKENINIDFTEPQTMVVRGRVERTYTEGNPAAGQLEDAAKAGAITEGEEPQINHQASVEDEADPNAAPQQPEKADKVDKVESAPQKPKNYSKYWLTERSVGEFSRSFSFPSRVDQDAVSASMKDGILSIQVPKAKKHESRRIAIN